MPTNSQEIINVNKFEYSGSQHSMHFGTWPNQIIKSQAINKKKETKL